MRLLGILGELGVKTIFVVFFIISTKQSVIEKFFRFFGFMGMTPKMGLISKFLFFHVRHNLFYVGKNVKILFLDDEKDNLSF